MKFRILLAVWLAGAGVGFGQGMMSSGPGVSPSTLDSYVTTNALGGTNQPVSILNGGGTGTFGALSNYTPKAAGQVVLSTANAGGQGNLAFYGSTSQGDFKHAFGLPTGVSSFGDPAVMPSNIVSSTFYFNGNPFDWSTNAPGESGIHIQNMNVFQDGSGLNFDIVTNDANGVPHVFSVNSIQIQYCPTNAPPGRNNTNLFGGYLMFVSNLSPINRGWVFGAPHGGVPGDTGSPNKYILGILGVDAGGNYKAQVRIPHIVAGVSTPDDPNDVYIFMADANLGLGVISNFTILSGTANGPFTVNNGATITTTNFTASGTVNASSTTAAMNLNSTNVTIGLNGTGNTAIGSFGRLKINSGGDTANGDIFNSQGSGMSMSGSTVFLSAGVAGIFAGTTTASSFTNDLRALSITLTNGITQFSNCIPVAVTVGASAFKFTNTTPAMLFCNIGDSTAITTSVGINGVTIMASTTDLNTQIQLKVNDYLTLTYSGGTPTLFTNK
jgi:hypothetical protein